MIRLLLARFLPQALGLEQGGKTAIQQVNQLRAQIRASVAKLGNEGAAPMYQAGIQAAQGLASDIRSQLAIIPYNGPPLTEQQVGEFRERLAGAVGPGCARADTLCWAWWRTGTGRDHHRCMLPGGHPGLCECCCGTKTGESRSVHQEDGQ